MRWSFVIGVIISLIALPGLVITSIPADQMSHEIPIIREGQEVGLLLFSTPDSLHAGDVSHISLSVQYDPAKVVDLGIGSVDLISRLDVPTMIISPVGESHVKIDPMYPTYFTWQINPENKEVYSGRIWLFEEGSNGDRLLLLAREFELNSKKVFGFSYPIVRVISIIAIIIGIGMTTFSFHLVSRTKRSHN